MYMDIENMPETTRTKFHYERTDGREKKMMKKSARV